MGKAIGLLHARSEQELADTPMSTIGRIPRRREPTSHRADCGAGVTASGVGDDRVVPVHVALPHHSRNAVAQPIQKKDRAYQSRIDDADRGQIEALIIAGWAKGLSVDHAFATAWDEGIMLASGRSWWRIAAGIADQSGRPVTPTKPATTPASASTDTQSDRSTTGMELGHHRSAQPVARGGVQGVFDHRHFIPQDSRLASRRTRSRRSGGRDVRGRVHRPRRPRRGARRYGPAMRSHDLKKLLADHSVVETHNRPRVSNDNPFSESEFRTMKYRLNYPGTFVT